MIWSLLLLVVGVGLGLAGYYYYQTKQGPQATLIIEYPQAGTSEIRRVDLRKQQYELSKGGPQPVTIALNSEFATRNVAGGVIYHVMMPQGIVYKPTGIHEYIKPDGRYLWDTIRETRVRQAARAMGMSWLDSLTQYTVPILVVLGLMVAYALYILANGTTGFTG